MSSSAPTSASTSTSTHVRAVPFAPTTAAGSNLKVTQARVLRSEWTKLRSLRSSIYTLTAAVVFMVGLGVWVSAITAGQYSTYTASDRASFNAISTSLIGVLLAQMAVGVLGVLLASGEYSTGMIRASLTVVPRRLPVLWGKLAVFAGTVFSVMLIASFAAFFLGQSLLNGQHIGVAISSPHALRSVIGAALYLTVAGLIGVALGALLRNTAAAVSVFTALFFVVPIVTNFFPASISDHVDKYLPSNAGGPIYGATGVDHALAPWTGFALVCGYAAVLIGVAAWRLRRADA